MSRWTVYGACAASLAIGLFFIFVWAPHPWGWEGFDGYHEFALTLARGGTFPTIDYPWGYAYYLAPFYRIFGDRPAIPLVSQAALNALMPLVVYRFARRGFPERIAIVAAVLTGLLSFNTIYASTQSSDAVCTVLFMLAVLAFASAGDGKRSAPLYAATGALLGGASQFRPNLILVPFLLAASLLIARRSRAAAVSGLVIVVSAAVMVAPWTMRNVRLTGEVIPTSTHGSMQLWYGTLQTGPYLKSRAYNPRRVFEDSSFPYTSLDHVPLVVTWRPGACGTERGGRLSYWTDRDATRRDAAGHDSSGTWTAELPGAVDPTAYYLRFGDGAAPMVFFVGSDHLGDLDRHADLLDVFDVVRLMRHAAWDEPLADAANLDFDHDGRVSVADAAAAAGILLRARSVHPVADAVVHVAADRITLALPDGSSLGVARQWNGRITDLDVEGAYAEHLLHAFIPMAALGVPARVCANADEPAINSVFYRREPHMMRRYLALALDNIARAPAAYLASSAYRAVRVFFIEGTSDPRTAQQFEGGGRIYRIAAAGSIVLLLLLIAGAWIAWRQGFDVALPLVLIAYIPATLAFVLTNMRYSVTVQPLVFIFVATALVSAWDWLAARRGPAPASAPAARRSAHDRTARRP